jgi:hypothetical protein
MGKLSRSVREAHLEKVEEIVQQCWVEYKEAPPGWVENQLQQAEIEKGDALDVHERNEVLLNVLIQVQNETNRLLSRISAQQDAWMVGRRSRELR